jgi:uncharacterized ion transporter superfamily protein YfcC
MSTKETVSMSTKKAPSKWTQIKIPDAIVIVLIVVCIACILTFIIPSSAYVRIQNEKGITVVDPEQFSWVENKVVMPWRIPFLIANSFVKNAAMFSSILFAGGAFALISECGALQAAVARVVKKSGGRTWLFIPILMTTFFAMCTTNPLNTFIPFGAILAILGKAMGFDSLTGVAILILGGSIGFSTGTFNRNTTLLAQEMAGLPLFSGLGFRLFSAVMYIIVSSFYLIRYANMVKADPTKSFTYELDRSEDAIGGKIKSLDEFGEMTVQRWLVFLSLAVTVAVMVFGCLNWGWSFPETAACFLMMHLFNSIVMRYSPNEAVNIFMKGARTALKPVILISIAFTISAVLNEGQILDTVIYSMAKVLNFVPRFLMGPAMFLINVIINIFITSGSGQAAASMPILLPLADMFGITRQTAILAFNFGDGFGNYILPYAPALMGILGIAGIPFDSWIKYYGKLFFIHFVLGSVLLVIAQIISYGPF